VRAVLSQRQAFPEDGKALMTMLGAAQQHATTEGSKALRISVRVALASGRQVNSEAVILIFDSSKEPYSILSWRDDPDGPHVR
jgi:general secretion pathway protein K